MNEQDSMLERVFGKVGNKKSDFLTHKNSSKKKNKKKCISNANFNSESIINSEEGLELENLTPFKNQLPLEVFTSPLTPVKTGNPGQPSSEKVIPSVQVIFSHTTSVLIRWQPPTAVSCIFLKASAMMESIP